MTDLERARDLIRKRATLDWDGAYLELGAIRLGARRTRRRRRIAFASVLFPCAALVMTLGWHHRSSLGGGAASTASLASMPPAPPLVFAEKPLRFSDGSLAVPADERTRVAIADDTPSRMTAELTAGRSRFEVVPSPTRMFTVRTGSVTVIVVGTIFTVDRRDDFVDVSVERGRVRVESPSGQQELGAGESASVRAAAIGDPASSPSSPTWRAPQKRSVASAELPTWRALAEQHRFQEAYRLLPEASPAIETPRDLLLAADSARLSGHPGAAVKYLATIVREYPKDFSAQLAAFSLGSIYLDQLDRPSDAAFRFGQAHALAGMGALSEDALARQVEALGRAGDAVKAHAQADEYVRLFPAGRHIEMVRRVGGLD